MLRHLTHVPIVLSADLRYQRWELFGDGQYIDVGASATLPGLLFTNANVHIKDGWAEGFLGYRLINCDKAFLSLFAGARYNYEGVNLSIFDNGDARSSHPASTTWNPQKVGGRRLDRLGRPRDWYARKS